MARSKKVKIIVITAATVVLAIVVFTIAVNIALVNYIKSDNFGFNKISAKIDRDGNPTVYINCSELSGYSVKPVEADTKEYKGESLTPINGDLGKYIVRVNLQDTEMANSFKEKYSPWTTYKIEGSSLSFMYTYTPDHGIAVFIGSDMPINEDDIIIKTLPSILKYFLF